MNRFARIGFLAVTALVLVVVLFVAVVGLGVGGIYVHDHGTLEVSVDGEPIDFDHPQYVEQDPTFHFHEGDTETWHHHPESLFHVQEFERMTITEALATLEIDVTESTVAVDGETYDDADDETTVSVTVNGESVDPASHELHDGEEIVVTVETADGS